MTVSGLAGAAAGGAPPWHVSSGNTDFFISHAGRDTGWAEWLAWQLQEAGYSVELDVWDWAPGEDFVARMQRALERADRMLAVCTEAYFSDTFGGAELRAAFAGRAGAEGRIVPVLVEPVHLPPLCRGDGYRVRPVMGVALWREWSGDRLLHQPRRSGHRVGRMAGLAAAAGQLQRRAGRMGLGAG